MRYLTYYKMYIRIAHKVELLQLEVDATFYDY